MLLKRLAVPLLGTALLAAPALAQTTQPSAAPPAAGQSATMGTGNFMTQMQPGHWLSSTWKVWMSTTRTTRTSATSVN